MPGGGAHAGRLRRRPPDEDTPNRWPTTAPLLELRGISKSFGSVQALTDVDFEVRERRGDGARRRQRRRQVDADQVHRRDPPDRLAARSSSRASRSPSTARRTRPGSGSRSSTRISRSATTSTSSRTCTSGARRTTRSTGLQGAGDGAASTAETLKSLSRHDDPLDPAAGRDALGRSAPVGRGRARRACGTRGSSSSTSRPPRSASRRRDRCSTSSSASPSRASPSCSSRTTCTTSSRSRTGSPCCGSAANIGVYERAKTTQQEIV